MVALQLDFHLGQTSFHDGDDALPHRAGGLRRVALLLASAVWPPPTVPAGVLSQERLRDGVMLGDFGDRLLAIVLVAALYGRPVDRAGFGGRGRRITGRHGRA